MNRPPVIHIVGRRNAGKTTLVCELIQEFSRRGLRVASVKHTHHNHELDTPGKDSHQHRVSGAAAVGILSPRMTALFIPQDREAIDEDPYHVFETAFCHCDLLIVEGDLHRNAPKVEVWRSVAAETPWAAEVPGILAVISDEIPPVANIPVWERRSIARIADRIAALLSLAGKQS